MKKRILSIMMIVVLMLGTCSVATAANTTGNETRDSLKSYGSIEYHKGNDKVVINSDDLYILADQIDQVKVNVAEQLEAMNTYFTAGNGIALNTDRNINVTHTRPYGYNSVDPLSINFDTILEGIAASQSVSPDVTDYGYSYGTRLYKNADGSLTTNGSEEGATQISVMVATADNLSAGTAAWVNGRLILGTGGDNKSYYDLGYQDAIEDTNNKTPDPENPDPGSSSGDVSKANVINLKGSSNSGTTYLVQEDISGAFIHIITPKEADATSLTFETLSSEAVAFTEICSIGDHYSSVDTVYYIPSLSKGTTINMASNCKYAYLYTFNGTCYNTRTGVDLSSLSSYQVKQDMKDVLLFEVQVGGSGTSSASLKNPSFVTIDNGTVPFKMTFDTKFGYTNSTGNLQYHKVFVYYIPELKAGTVMTHDGNSSYLIY